MSDFPQLFYFDVENMFHSLFRDLLKRTQKGEQGTSTVEEDKIYVIPT